MLPGMEMLACPNLAISPEVMQHIVYVESGANPYAIGVVDGQLTRQPKNLAEALATAKMLDTKGYNFSVGLAQVNRVNLGRYGLDSYQKAFNACANLSAGAHILAGCYARAHGNWGKAFSCYYSGNFTTGFRDGYVRKVYASIQREATLKKASPSPTIGAITLSSGSLPATRATDLLPVTVRAPGGENYRVALRSMAIDATAAASVSVATAAIGHAASDQTITSPDSTSADSIDANASEIKPAAIHQASASPMQSMTAIEYVPVAGSHIDAAVFVPEVRGPNDLPDASSHTGSTAARMTPANSDTDHNDLRREQRDAAFVF